MTATNATARRIHNPVQQDYATLLVSAEESGGERSLFEIELSPGGKNMPHTHLTYAEHFEVLEGTLTVELADGPVQLGPGESIVATAGAVHNFNNLTDEDVRYRVELRPGHKGFERAVQIGYGLGRDGKTNAQGIPKNLLHLALLVEMAEMGLVGPHKILTPVIGLLARAARRRGIDAVLTERYCAW